LGLFVEHLVCAPKIKGLETPLKSAQPPAKSTQNQSQINGAQSKSGFVPKINKKNEQKWRKRKKKRVLGYVGEKLEIGVFGGRRWVEMAGGGAVGGWEVMGSGGAWWVWILGSVWRRRTEKEKVWGVRRYSGMRGNGGEMT
jgi:hypothetical protein